MPKLPKGLRSRGPRKLEVIQPPALTLAKPELDALGFPVGVKPGNSHVTRAITKDTPLDAGLATPEQIEGLRANAATQEHGS